MAGSLIDLGKDIFECCKEALIDAKLMYDNGRYKNTLNRAYYAIFYAIRGEIPNILYKLYCIVGKAYIVYLFSSKERTIE